MRRLLVFGLGYSGRAVALAARAQGWAVTGTSRSSAPADDPIPTIPFDGADQAIAGATHLLVTAPPDPTDPVLARYQAAIHAAPALRWIGYLSSTVVYGNRDGAWVTEATPPAPSQPRGERRLAAEQAWAALGGRVAVDLFRLAGIYGPGRSAFDDLRAGRARRMIKPGHCFGRIHRDDIAAAVLAAMAQDRPLGLRVLNLNNDEPAESAAVMTEAATLLGVPLPPESGSRTRCPRCRPWRAASGPRIARSRAWRPGRRWGSPGATRPIARGCARSWPRKRAGPDPPLLPDAFGLAACPAGAGLTRALG